MFPKALGLIRLAEDRKEGSVEQRLTQIKFHAVV